MDAKFVEQILAFDQHVDQMRDRRALVAADIGNACLEDCLGDREDAFAAKDFALAETQRAHLFLNDRSGLVRWVTGTCGWSSMALLYFTSLPRLGGGGAVIRDGGGASVQAPIGEDSRVAPPPSAITPTPPPRRGRKSSSNATIPFGGFPDARRAGFC